MRLPSKLPTSPHALAALAAIAAAVILSLTAWAPADAAQPKSCTRGGAKLELASKSVRVVRRTLEKDSARETRRERLLACWVATGKRVRLAEEIDSGDDNAAHTSVEIVQDRYVGVVATNEGGVSVSTVARVYDAKQRELVHTSAECENVDQGDLTGVLDVVFLDGGGMAMACRRLLLYRNAGSELETIEPDGTYVSQLGVSRHTQGFGQRLFWIVDDSTAKSMAL